MAFQDGDEFDFDEVFGDDKESQKTTATADGDSVLDDQNDDDEFDDDGVSEVQSQPARHDSSATELSAMTSADQLTEGDRDRTNSAPPSLPLDPLNPTGPRDIQKPAGYSLSELLARNSDILHCGCPTSGRQLARQALGDRVFELDQLNSERAEGGGETQTFEGPSHTS
ncbi:MAG: hypothetical protein COV52_05940 [Gammaproteobacteria bacterium CG11_big_fil_rev_8_21_14_0_20_46_22]|nr:MAG: hypothetical protein COW05_07720 [Gammaproteobacteria bacterium CG12_big_fil_rev_8_21_14_0_65_46_12]PIR11044.1 MAG: hypothetical protein COV52_05940 [Gammaproteobacteria bacterium CG11_big_fil_rev_8_21_14_0_20_46_22]